MDANLKLDLDRQQPSSAIVKICGLQEVVHARMAARVGADLLGFMLAPSRRRISVNAVRTIREKLEEDGRRPPMVGVFVNETANAINTAVETAGLDAVQLSGDESPAMLDEVGVPVIKALRPLPGAGAEQLRRQAELWLDRPRPAVLLLIDAHVTGSYGGTGRIGDWAAAQLLAQRYPVLLAGGLTADNVVRAIETVRPLGVDVSSGVELDGVKEPDRIAAFIAAARKMAHAPR